jgi:DNA polymerase III subunit beta
MVLPPGRGQVIFRLRDIELVSQLIEGAYPDYEQVIPRAVQDPHRPDHLGFS